LTVSSSSRQPSPITGWSASAQLCADAADRAINELGTIAVIASGSQVDHLHASLAARFGDAVGRGAAGLNRTVAVLTPQESKGLEFDAAIVVEPQLIIDEIVRGAAALYVAMTRPTQRLHLVTSAPLPRGVLA
jgi:DNA helicase IV